MSGNRRNSCYLSIIVVWMHFLFLSRAPRTSRAFLLSSIRPATRPAAIFGGMIETSSSYHTASYFPSSSSPLATKLDLSSTSSTSSSEHNDIMSTATSPSDQHQEMSESSKPILAKKIPIHELEACGKRLREGHLVSFPTETVYGLGCHAMDETAVGRCFAAKERPLTDPLIVHVTQQDQAFQLWNANENSNERLALQALCDEFWPGPLTIVAQAKPTVPSIVMANTGFVACRSPSHPIARTLIDHAKVPIAAPSANKFGHISPTRAQHVWDDLLHEDVWIVDDTTTSSATDEQMEDQVCNVGVESSVCKVSADGHITLLRQGAVSVQDIQACLEKANLLEHFRVNTQTKKTTEDHVATVAPGQTIRHYSPDVPSFMLSESKYGSSVPLSPQETDLLSRTVLIDFGGKLSKWKESALAYRDLSASGSSAEAATAVFDTLRWAERVQGASQILFPELLDTPTDALAMALKDRLTRAASGEVIDTLSPSND